MIESSKGLGSHRCRCANGAGFTVDIRTRGELSLTEREVSTLLERLAASLDRVADSIAHVRVRLADVNGPKGGVDKLCSVQIRFARRGSIDISRRAESVWDAVSQTLRTAKRRSHEAIARGRRRRGRKRLGPALLSGA